MQGQEDSHPITDPDCVQQNSVLVSMVGPVMQDGSMASWAKSSRWIPATGSFLSPMIGLKESPDVNMMPTHKSSR